MAGGELVARGTHLDHLNREKSYCDDHGRRFEHLCDLPAEVQGARSRTPPFFSPCSKHSETSRGSATSEGV